MIVDEDDLLEVMRKLVLRNEEILVEDLEIQGKPRSIGQVVTNKHARDSQYYFIRILSPLSRAVPATGNANLWINEYRVQMDVVDFARLQQEDMNQPYELVNKTFRLFTGRLVELMIAQNAWMSGERGRYRRPLDRARLAIDLANDSGITREASGLFAGCVARISFNMIGQC